MNELVKLEEKNSGTITDMVNSPAHYKLEGLPVESVDVIRSVLGNDGYRSWCKGNTLKYLFRAGKKDVEIQDLKKAQKFLDWLIKEWE